MLSLLHSPRVTLRHFNKVTKVALSEGVFRSLRVVFSLQFYDQLRLDKARFWSSFCPCLRITNETNSNSSLRKWSIRRVFKLARKSSSFDRALPRPNDNVVRLLNDNDYLWIYIDDGYDMRCSSRWRYDWCMMMEVRDALAKLCGGEGDLQGIVIWLGGSYTTIGI